MVRARMPADIEREDTLLANLTARQLLIIATPALALWGLWSAVGDLVALPVVGAVAVPVMGAAVVAALVRRDGLSLDRLLVAAVGFLRSPKRRSTTAPAAAEVPSWISARPGPLPAPLELPVAAIGDDGVIDLGEHGAALILDCSTVNVGLRTEEERAALVAGFASYLNSLATPVQILVRAESVRLDPLVAALDATAPDLPHPALEQAAREHADYLSDLAASHTLLYRRVLLVLREASGTARQQAATLKRRADDAARALAGAGSTATPLDGGAAAAVLAAAADPTRTGGVAPEDLASPDAVIAGPETEQQEEG
ncbi:hypothetical protein LP52_17900 [Streptomonospora alba]|uniref:PrgI family protein n=1 Tax=Streptomonospora alba TaxID=183763 RepID=A0A0C2JFB3_9ACTN|nr:PrgI family protein [Streptomonospora alba]KIH97595.1 hypothetical protein LP52_17900 [Streptomonospora alba]